MAKSRITSKEAYEQIKSNGTLGKTLDMVLECVALAGPINQTEACEWINKRQKTNKQKYSYSPRFAVLERMGLIEQHSVEPCPVSGRPTVKWASTCLTVPIMKSTEATKLTAKSKNLDTIESLAKKIKDLERKILRLEHLSSNISTGQMTFI